MLRYPGGPINVPVTFLLGWLSARAQDFRKFRSRRAVLHQAGKRRCGSRGNVGVGKAEAVPHRQVGGNPF